MKAFLAKLMFRTWGSPELIPVSTHKVDTQAVAGGLEYAPMASLLWCLSSLAIVYFGIYSFLLIVRLVGQLQRTKGEAGQTSSFESLQDILGKAELTLQSFPMICVLFLAAQMQSLHASGGREQPSSLILTSMEIATSALLLITLLSVVLPAVSDKTEVDMDIAFVGGTQLISEAREKMKAGKVAKSVLLWCGVICSCLAWLALQGACAFICVSVMQRHCEMWKDHSPLQPNPALSPAVSCTVNLTILFFAVHLLLAIVCMCDDIFSRKRGRPKLFDILRLASNTVFFAPMLCVLFISAQVRAMQVNHPVQDWAHAAFHVCTIGMVLQTLLTIALPYLPCGIDIRRGTSWMEDDVEFEYKYEDRPVVKAGLVILRYIPMLLVCGGLVVVIVSVLTNSSSDGSVTPPVPPATLCTIALTLQFFFVYIGLRMAVSLRAATHGLSGDGGVLVRTLYAASATVHFCPMLAILFVALRMRAQQVSGQGNPQEWAQACMYLSTGAVFAQLIVCLVIGMVTGSPPEVDDQHKTFHVNREGANTAEVRGAIIDKVIIALQGVSLTLLYGGAVAVCVALYTITPETIVASHL